MKVLINSVEYDYKRASIDFSLISTNSTKGWKEKGEIILNSLRLILYLIENDGPLTISDDNHKLLTTEITVNNVFKLYKIESIDYIDFQTNLHRVYASQQMGLLNATSYHIKRTWKDFENSLVKYYKFYEEKN